MFFSREVWWSLQIAQTEDIHGLSFNPHLGKTSGIDNSTWSGNVFVLSILKAYHCGYKSIPLDPILSQLNLNLHLYSSY
jgi:hypothetical protein